MLCKGFSNRMPEFRQIGSRGNLTDPIKSPEDVVAGKSNGLLEWLRGSCERLRRSAERCEYAMHHRHRIFGPALREHRAQLVVEGRNLLRCEARADAGARANPAAPCLV